MTTRQMIRLGSFVSAAFLTLLAFLVYTRLQLDQYKRREEFGYLRALQEVTSHLNAISADLKRSSYAGTPAQIAAISAKVWKNADSAKTSFSSLPLGDMRLDVTYRFLSQVGDYSMYLSRKALRGEQISGEERENFARLQEYAQQLNRQLADIEYTVASGQLELSAFLRSGVPYGRGENLAFPVSESLGFEDMEQRFEGYPTLIYDGPFSDHLLDKDPQLIRGKAEVSLEEAQKTAARFAGVDASTLIPGDEERSRMPSYTFAGGTVDAAVTKNGGFVTYYINAREIGGRELNAAAAREKGGAYLKAMGLDSMRETYYDISGGIMTINYAYSQRDTVCYTDLIKVGVALDNGKIVFYDARGFVANHRERSLPEPRISLEDARRVVSDRLQILSSGRALIPTPGGNEAQVYEFKCRGREGEHVLVYVNAETCAEEEILLLIESENGVLTI